MYSISEWNCVKCECGESLFSENYSTVITIPIGCIRWFRSIYVHCSFRITTRLARRNIFVICKWKYDQLRIIFIKDMLTLLINSIGIFNQWIFRQQNCNGRFVLIFGYLIKILFYKCRRVDLVWLTHQTK